MKIIVNNETEKELIKRFIEQFVDDDVLTFLTESKYIENAEIFEEDVIDGTEALFLENGLLNAIIQVDKENKTYEMYVDYESVLDVCSVCKSSMCINMDFDIVTYEEMKNHPYGKSVCSNCETD